MEYDYRNFLRIELINTKGEVVKTLSFSDGEPEDNNLNRNFNDCYIIEDLVKAAVGNSITIERKEYEW